jgi:hypothetical protein
MTIASGQQALAADVLKSLNASGYLQLTDSSELTIATGAVSVTTNFYRVDTEADAATDDLDTITAGSGVADGHILILRAENAARTVVVKHNTGNIMVPGATDLVLDDSHDTAWFIYDGNLTKWIANSHPLIIKNEVALSWRNAAGTVKPAITLNGSDQLALITAGSGFRVIDSAQTTVLLSISEIGAFTTAAGAIPTASLADASVTAAKLAAAVAGDGLSGGAGSALSVNVDGTSIQIVGDTLSVIGTPATNPLPDLAYINDSANANMTIGLTINQGANDNEILAFKSSDVAHGMTSAAETDTFATFSKTEAGAGGMQITALTDADASFKIGLSLRGVLGLAAGDTTKSTSAEGAVEIVGMLKSGAGFASLGANENILVVSGAGATTRFILDSDGDSHQDVGTAWTNFDAHDDAELLTALSVHVSAPGDVIRKDFGEFLDYNRARLEALRLVTFNEDGHHFVNMSRLTMLLVGAVRQVSTRLDTVLTRLEGVERKLLTA